jgi:hypothetical protein
VRCRADAALQRGFDRADPFGMGRLWFLRRPLILFGSVALVAALLVGIGNWQSSQHRKRILDCFAAAETVEKSAATPLVASIEQTPVPPKLSGMPIRQSTDGAPVIGPWTTHLTGRVVARTIASWLPLHYVNHVTVTATRVPAGRQWMVRADDRLDHGVFLQVMVKPLLREHGAIVLGSIGDPPGPNC